MIDKTPPHHVRVARDEAAVRAHAAIRDLSSLGCDCPYETERELADEIRRLVGVMDAAMFEIRETHYDKAHRVLYEALHPRNG
jgi:hypothetical protein